MRCPGAQFAYGEEVAVVKLLECEVNRADGIN
jgi:hypothetical protein